MRHFFHGGGNWSIQRKPQSCSRSMTKWWFTNYTVHWTSIILKVQKSSSLPCSDSCNFLISMHCHLLDFPKHRGTSLLMISFWANWHKAFLSTNVKICPQLTKNAESVPKNYSELFWGKPTGVHFMFTFFLQNTNFYNMHSDWKCNCMIVQFIKYFSTVNYFCIFIFKFIKGINGVDGFYM